MKGLRNSKYACFATWMYCILWFLVQDLAKVGTYRMLEYLGREDAERMQMQVNRGKITSMINAEQRELRKKGVKIGSDEGYKSTGSHSAEMASEIAHLKKELAELKSLVMSKK